MMLDRARMLHELNKHLSVGKSGAEANEIDQQMRSLEPQALGEKYKSVLNKDPHTHEQLPLPDAPSAH